VSTVHFHCPNDRTYRRDGREPGSTRRRNRRAPTGTHTRPGPAFAEPPDGGSGVSPDDVTIARAAGLRRTPGRSVRQDVGIRATGRTESSGKRQVRHAGSTTSTCWK